MNCTALHSIKLCRPALYRPQDNLYWLGLLTHLQCEGVPLKSVACLRDLRAMYEAATLEDIYDAYAQVGGQGRGQQWGEGLGS